MKSYVSPYASENLKARVKEIEQSHADLSSYLKETPITHLPFSWNDPPHEEWYQYEWVLNGFGELPVENLSLLSMRRDEPWETIGPFAKMTSADSVAAVMTDLPQLKQRLYTTLRSLNLPILFVPLGQAQILPSVMAATQCSALILMQRDLGVLWDVLHHLSSVRYRIILAPGEKPTVSDSKFSFEMHVVPSMVGLFQCASHIHDAFHMSDRFVWEWDSGHIRVSEIHNRRRFLRAELPGTYEWIDETCRCGRSVHLKII